MGRKKKDIGVKEKKIFFRVSDSLYEVIAYSAKKSGLSISEFCRRAVLNQPIKKLPVIIHDEKEIAQALRNIDANIKRLGNNLNQIARHLNQGGAITQQVLDDVEQELTKLDLSIDNFNRAVEKEYGIN